MIKKEYMKPTMKVVLLQHRTHLLQASPVRSVDAGDTGIGIEDTPAGNDFWGR